jgi:SSS family solute:Na+ symporter
MLDYLIIASYLGVMLGAGWIGLRRTKNTEDYLVAGRRLGYGFYAGTLAAVVLGGASTIGGVRLGYVYGISGMWLVFMLGLGIIVLSVFLSDKLTSLKVFTVSEMLGRRYGVSSRVIGGLVMAAYDLMVAVTATLAIGTVLDVVLGVPRVPAIIVGGTIVVIYSVLGGMWSITLTDILQFGIMTVGIFGLLLPISLSRAGGWSGLQETLPTSYFDITAIGGGTILTYFLIYFFGIIIGQDIWQRVFTARDGKVARQGGLFAGVYCLLYALAGAVIGMAARALLPDLSVPDNAFAAVTTATLPVGVTGLVLAAALAAVMSTASATMLAASTILANDVTSAPVGAEPADAMGRQRLFTFGVGVVMIALSIAVQDVVGALTIAYNLLVGALLVPIVGGLFWARSTGKGALAAIATGGTVVIALMLTLGMFANEPIYWGLAASAVAFVVVSLSTTDARRTDRVEMPETSTA